MVARLEGGGYVSSISRFILTLFGALIPFLTFMDDLSFVAPSCFPSLLNLLPLSSPLPLPLPPPSTGSSRLDRF